MIYLEYALLAVINIFVTLLAILLAPILPLFASNKSGPINNGSGVGVEPRLPSWLNWFQTPDNSLLGDDTFIIDNLDVPMYWHQVKWLLRNPAYSFALRYIPGLTPATFTGNNLIKDNDNAVAGHLTVHADSLFQYTLVRQLFGSSRCLYVNFGWNIRALVDPNVKRQDRPYEATFVFSPRISGFR